MSYKHIIFDLGNVLLNFKAEAFTRSKISDKDKAMSVYKAIFQSEEWLLLDRGILTQEEAKTILMERHNQHASWIELIFDHWIEGLTPIEDTIEVFRKLKASGYKLYYLSNFQLLAFEAVIKQNSFFELFDGGIVSYREKFIKPEKEIYKRMINQYNIEVRESIFIDDTIENIEAAKKLEINTILFVNSEDLIEKLKTFNIHL